MKPVFVLAGLGLNCEEETAHAYRLVGLEVEIVSAVAWLSGARRLEECALLHLPGGFSYGDRLGAGFMLADRVRHSRRADASAPWSELLSFVARGGYVVGVCNGFQVLVRTGLLPNLGGHHQPEVALLPNRDAEFLDRWVALEADGALAPLGSPELPVRHGEGRLVFADRELAARAVREQRVILRYQDNPNGSWLDAAGLADASGRVLGLMPHPEAAVWPEHHPAWTRGSASAAEVHGLRLFQLLAARLRAESES